MEDDINTEIIYVCSLCYGQYKTIPDLKNHMISVHNLKEKEPNCLPPVSFNQFKLFVKKDFTFECSQLPCRYKFASQKDLNLHVSCHSVDGVNKTKFKCFQCDKEEDLWKLLTIHLWRAHKTNLGLLSCPICEYKSLSALQIWRHMKAHKNWRSKVLKPVKKPAVKATEVAAPKTNYYSEKTCEICERKFVNSKTLSKHVKSVHLKIKPFICNVCGMKCSRKSVLEIHMRQHTGERPLSCSHCSFKTRDGSSLAKHTKRHQDESLRKYKCTDCDFTAIQSSNYKTHIKINHPESYRKISCSLCGFATVDPNKLTAHRNDHDKGLVVNKLEEPPVDVKKCMSQKKTLLPNEISSDCFLPMESTDSISHEPTLDTGGVTIPAHSEDAQF